MYTIAKANLEQSFFNAIDKFDVTSGKTIRWYKQDYYPGEPIFVAKPKA